MRDGEERSDRRGAQPHRCAAAREQRHLERQPRQPEGRRDARASLLPATETVTKNTALRP